MSFGQGNYQQLVEVCHFFLSHIKWYNKAWISNRVCFNGPIEFYTQVFTIVRFTSLEFQETNHTSFIFFFGWHALMDIGYNIPPPPLASSEPTSNSQSSAFWTVEYYQKYFDIDSMEVCDLFWIIIHVYTR